MAVDYRALKAITLLQAAAYLDLKLTRNGVSEGQYPNYRVPCPVCGSEDPHSLSITPDKPGFRCMSCGGRGSDAVSLVAFVRRTGQSKAAQLLQEHFRIGNQVRAHAPTQAAEPVALKPRDIAIELLGFTDEDVLALGIELADDRVKVPLRSATGHLIGRLGIATTVDQAPLILIERNLDETPKQPADELRKLFRIVK